MVRAAAVALILSLALPLAAGAAERVIPPAPETEPDWAAVRKEAEAKLLRGFFDPQSAQFTWTEGFRWGYIKPLLGKRTYQWVACGNVNAKNRMGGYVGATPFRVGLRTDGTMFTEVESKTEITQVASCDRPDVHVDPQAALLDAPAGAAQAPASTLSVADELTKLVDLRDKGILSPAEFDQQKTKLLAK